MADTSATAPTDLRKEIEEHNVKLKPTETAEKNTLPDQDAIKQEKQESNLREEIEKGTDLRHVQCQEKNPLPTKETIEEEKRLSSA